MKLAVITLCTSLGLAGPVQAADWVIGVGGTNLGQSAATESGVFMIEAHGAPVFQFGAAEFSFAAAAQVDGNGDVWFGGGLSAVYQLSATPWFAEASLMPGLYFEADSGSSLGSVLEFRSVLGVGYRISDRDRVSLAAFHISNGGLGRSNPGLNGIALRWRRSF